MRRPPERNPAPIARRRDDLFVDERTYELLTLVFGGGVEVRDNIKPADPVTPVRASAIRGHLRFWWRACNPRGVTTVAELHRAEAEVFGSTERASPLVVEVVEQPPTPAEVAVLEGAFGAREGFREIAYGAFPLRDTEHGGARHGTLHRFHGAWTARFTYPRSIERDARAALWAFAHFGALGGRTRRGFGALAQRGPLETLDEGWSEYVHGAEVGWPHLMADRAASLRIGKARENADKAHAALLGALQGLRQGPGVGRKRTPENDRGKHPGRSYWPEADAIRAATDQRAARHRHRVTAHDLAPRAAFGTPIIFHFKDHKAGDPPDATLNPVGKGRFASRLVLRPHRNARGEIEPMALILGHPEPERGYELTWGRGGRAPVVVEATEREAATLGLDGRPSPLVKNGKTYRDPLRRFLEEIK